MAKKPTQKAITQFQALAQKSTPPKMQMAPNPMMGMKPMKKAMPKKGKGC